MCCVKFEDNRTSRSWDMRKLQSLNLCYFGLNIIVNLYYLSPPSIWKRYVPDNCVFWNAHTISDNHDKKSICIDHSPARWGSRWRIRSWFFFFGRVNTKGNPFLFVFTSATNIPWLLRIFAMFTIPRKDLEHVNWPSSVYWALPSQLCVSIWKRLFSDDVVIKHATSLTMLYIWDLTYFS